MITKGNLSFLVVLFALFLAGAGIVSAQSTEFTYQGRLNDGGLAATGSYDMQFSLFDAVATGNQLGSTSTLPAVSVSNGIFTVHLDFGPTFTGPDRYLQISIKPSGSPDAFTLLTPRQPIRSAPYSVRSLNASNADTALNSTQLGGVAANQFVQTGDTRLSDARDPLPGNANYIQNGTSQQPLANFN